MDESGRMSPQSPGEPTTAAERVKGPRRLSARAGLIAVAVCGLAAGSYGVASAATSSPSAATIARQAVAGATTPSKKAPTPRAGGNWQAGPGLGGGLFGRGPGGFGQTGTISHITATTITIDTEFGMSLTMTTNGSTTYQDNGKTIARSSLVTGEEVAFLPVVSSQASAGSSAAKSEVARLVEVILPHVSGKVVSSSGSQIVVAQEDGLYVTVNTSTSTSYQVAGQAAKASDVTQGSVVSVTGTASSDHTEIDATVVQIVLPTFSGRVTGVSGTTITITGFEGTTETVTTTSSTVFSNRSGKTSISSVAKGDIIEASGTVGSANSLSAVVVFVGPAASSMPEFPGGGGPSMFGRGRFGGPGGAGSAGGLGRGNFGGSSGWGGGPPMTSANAFAGPSTAL